MNTYLIALKDPSAPKVFIPAEKVEESADCVWFIFYNFSGKEVGRYRQEAVSYWYVCDQDPLPPILPPEMGGAAAGHFDQTTTAAKPLEGDNALERVWNNPEDSVYDEKPNFVVRPSYPNGVSSFECIQETGYSGYVYEDVLKSLSPEQAADLKNWMNGQTMALRENPNGEGVQTIIYAWDYDRWLQGLPVID